MTKSNFAVLFDFPGVKPTEVLTQEQILQANMVQQEALALTELCPRIASYHRMSAQRSRDRIAALQAKQKEAA